MIFLRLGMLCAAVIVLVSCGDDTPKPEIEATMEATPISPTTTPTLVPTRLPTQVPTATSVVLPSLRDFTNGRWLEQQDPQLASAIKELSWIRDGIAGTETEVIQDLLYIAVLSNYLKILTHKGIG